MERKLYRRDKPTATREITKYIEWLALDSVSAGAILFYSVSVHFGQKPTLPLFFGFIVAMWLIYLIDRLLDAYKANNQADERTIFYLKYRNGIVSLVALLCLFGIFLGLALDRYLFVLALLIAFFAVLYLLNERSLARLGLKELSAASLFSLAVCLVPFSLRAFSLNEVIVFLQILVIAAMNLLILSKYDQKKDVQLGFHSLYQKLTPSSFNHLLNVLALITIVFTLIQYIFIHGSSTFALMIVLIVISYLLLNANILKHRIGLRIWADGILIMAGLVYLITKN